jgi:outer membrane receptor for ferrienterochelin and colicin
MGHVAIYKTLIATVLCFISSISYAQITGTVRSGSKEPLIGASIRWMNTNQGTLTNHDGHFNLSRSEESDLLIISYVGFTSDTVKINKEKAELEIVLNENTIDSEEVIIKGHQSAMKAIGLTNTTTITSGELTKAACCNLGESFTNNPSVDVSYADAATGAKQIKLLGLSGSYVQMLTENIPNFRGAASPYALGYVPGPWMQSIQVSKGSASVKNGYESITGQINIEYLKPQGIELIEANVYANTKSRVEANADANFHLDKNKKLSTAILAHYEQDFGNHDDNGDGFLDQPKVKQINLQNRWAWMGDNYIFQAAVKVLGEERESGQTTHSHNGETAMSDGEEIFKIGLKTQRYEAFAKNAYIFNHEHNTNIALMLSGSLHNLDSDYGHKFYNVDERNGYASLMFETEFNEYHKLSTGLSLNHDYYSQDYRLTHDINTSGIHKNERETTAGAYAQYTYTLNERLTAMGGIRIDNSSLYGTFVTPRAHIKWSPIEALSFRASTGKGYRTVHALAENNNLMASGRRMIIDPLKQEAAWNYGISGSLTLQVAGHPLIINAEYYYTDFKSQAIIDYDSNPTEIRITNLNGSSYSHIYQVDATYTPVDGLTVTAAYRRNNVKCTYGGQLLERPLTSRSKGLLTASYKTPLEIWQFDATLQLNGGGRIPGEVPTTFKSFEQVNAQITRWFRKFSIYLGGENLTGFRQKQTIIGADKPWSEKFDPTMVWGPVHGAMFYLGFRLKIDRS